MFRYLVSSDVYRNLICHEPQLAVPLYESLDEDAHEDTEHTDKTGDDRGDHPLNNLCHQGRSAGLSWAGVAELAAPLSSASPALSGDPGVSAGASCGGSSSGRRSISRASRVSALRRASRSSST